MATALHPENPTAGRRDLRIASIWAFAEATVFFIVPDVWLTRIAMKNRHRALIACGVATVAAILGGVVMFRLGQTIPQRAEALLVAIPAISPAMVDDVRRQMETRGDVAMLRGPVTGTPYKIYAVEAGRLGHGIVPFIGWSVAARLPRFLLLVVVVAAATKKLRRVVPEKSLGFLHAGLWVAFYVGYFIRFGG